MGAEGVGVNDAIFQVFLTALNGVASGVAFHPILGPIFAKQDALQVVGRDGVSVGADLICKVAKVDAEEDLAFAF